MPRGEKSAYTDKQKRKAEHIEQSYAAKGIPEAEAEAQALRALEAPEQVAAAADPYAVSDPAQLNFAWASAGSAGLLPSRAYDNGDAVFLVMLLQSSEFRTQVSALVRRPDAMGGRP